MKISDIISVTSIAIFGTILAYFLMNGILGDPKDKTVSFEYLVSATSALAEPDGEIFNSGAINPTVEVYVGSCEDQNGDGVISNVELVECGANKEFSTGATTSTSTTDSFYEQYGMTEEESEAVNSEEGYAAGTTPEQRQNVQSQVEEFQQQQQQQNTQGGEGCDYNGDGVVSTAEIERCTAARQETTSR